MKIHRLLTPKTSQQNVRKTYRPPACILYLLVDNDVEDSVISLTWKVVNSYNFFIVSEARKEQVTFVENSQIFQKTDKYRHFLGWKVINFDNFLHCF